MGMASCRLAWVPCLIFSSLEGGALTQGAPALLWAFGKASEEPDFQIALGSAHKLVVGLCLIWRKTVAVGSASADNGFAHGEERSQRAQVSGQVRVEETQPQPRLAPFR